jgi:hypothetical protein
MPSAGSLRDRVVIERYDNDEQAWRVPVEYARIPAQVVALGDERYEFRIRWRADLDTLRDSEPTTRLRYNNLILDIVDLVEVQRRREIRITAEARRVAYDNLATGAKRHQSWPSE